jgi:UPF0755 protein
VLAAGAAGAWFAFDRWAAQALSLGETRVVEFERGETLTRFANRLAADGVLEHPELLIALARWQRLTRELQAGEYALAPGTTPPQLLQQLATGRVVQYAVTLVEGWTARQALDAIAAQDTLRHTLDGLDEAQVLQRLGLADRYPSLEGLLFPDTYFYARGSTDLQLLERAVQRMHEQLDSAWQGRAVGLPLSSPYEALVLASLVEKETALASERTEIAGVFVRRLQRGMRLQTDPTVIYGLGSGFDGNLTRAHLRQPSPYNTYVIRGLPPTPICLVGAEALYAALNPAPGETLFFVARGDGSHVFSKTLEEHQAAVRRYQIEARAEDCRSTPRRSRG